MVYYITWGDGQIVKIGTTERPTLRLKAHRATYGSIELIAAHPGGRREEATQHRRFAHLLVAGERELFQYGADLIEHVSNLRCLWPNWRDLVTEIELAYRAERKGRRARSSGQRATTGA